MQLDGSYMAFMVTIFMYFYTFMRSDAQSCLTLTPWAVGCQASLSIEFSRQEYWSGVPFPPPGDLSDPGIEPMSLVSPAFAGMFFTTVPPGKHILLLLFFIKKTEMREGK